MKVSSTSCLIAGLLYLGSCGTADKKKEEATDQDNGVVAVTLDSVTTATRTQPILVAGALASLQEVKLSFKVGGIIERVHVREGQTVRKGQLLATLDRTEINAQVAQAKLSSEKAERDFKRVGNLLRDTAATEEQLQNARTGYDLAKQNLEIATFNQGFSKIVAPVDGVVTRKFMSDGEFTGPGTSVLLVSSTRSSDWVVRVGVSDRDWARLKKGDQAKVVLDAYPDDVFGGTVTELAQAADPVTRLYDIEVKVQPAGKRFASGLYAKAELSSSQSRSYSVVPVESIVEGNGSHGFVFVVEGGKAKKLPVTIGYLDKDKVLIRDGLDGVKHVIAGGSGFLTDGTPVTVK